MERGSIAQVRALPLTIILTVQVVLSLRLVTRNTAFTDEALYLWAGRLEWSHWLHHTLTPAFTTYFSGAPVLYPPVAALANSVGGLVGARVLSLLLHARRHCAPARRHPAHLRPPVGCLCRRAVRRARIGCSFSARFATYDAMALFLLAASTWLGIRAASCRTTSARLALILAGGAHPGHRGCHQVRGGPVRPGGPDRRSRASTGGNWGAGRARSPRCSLQRALPRASAWRWPGAGSPMSLGSASRHCRGQPGNWPIFGILYRQRRLGRHRRGPGRDRRHCRVRCPAVRATRVLAWTLAAAGFLAPAEQARIHVFTSLFKHVAFGGWFAAAVGRLRADGVHPRGARPSRPAGRSRSSRRPLRWPTVLGQHARDQSVRHLAEHRSGAAGADRRAARSPGHAARRTRRRRSTTTCEGIEPWQSITSIPDSSAWALAQDVRQRRFSVHPAVVRGRRRRVRQRGPRGQADAGSVPAQHRSSRVLYGIISDGGYRLIARIPYRTTSFKSDYLLWAREGPRR